MTTSARRPTAPHEKDAAARTLEMDIIFGRLIPGQRLIEDELMTRFGQSRHRIRCAINTLITRGLAVREVNRGAHVCSFTREEIVQMYALRNILQDAALRAIPFPVPPATLKRLRALHHAHIEATKAGDFDAVFRANNLFHAAVFACCGNDMLADAIEYRAQRSFVIRTNNFKQQGYLDTVQREHAAMIDALEQGDAERLVTLSRVHIERPMQSYLARYHEDTRAAS